MHDTSTVTTSSGVRYRQLRYTLDPEIAALWTWLRPEGRPCFNPGLLDELIVHFRHVERTGKAPGTQESPARIRYDVLASDVPGVFNLGGDLSHFVQLIRAQDRAGLLSYATRCVDLQWRRIRGNHRDMTTISLVQGRALGGGFESALASQYIIAERSAKLGLPEIRFNLFPGMGAWSLLARKIGTRMAASLMSQGSIHSAEECHQLGLIDVLVEDGEGESAVRAFIRQHSRRAVGLKAIMKCREYLEPITRDELMDITSLWVDSALAISAADLKLMQHLVERQSRLVGASANVEVACT